MNRPQQVELTAKKGTKESSLWASSSLRVRSSAACSLAAAVDLSSGSFLGFSCFCSDVLSLGDITVDPGYETLA